MTHGNMQEELPEFSSHDLKENRCGEVVSIRGCSKWALDKMIQSSRVTSSLPLTIIECWRMERPFQNTRDA